jgi:membrane associated rhomboid family serine protease
MYYPPSYYSNATIKLLSLIIFVFFLQIVIGESFIYLFFLNPASLQIWQLISSIFLHAGLMHLFLNCYALVAFGSFLEQKVGTRLFLIIFFLAGIFGNLLYLFTIYIGIIPPIPALGASGAIYGILGALALISPNLVILLFGFIPIKIKDAAILWVIIEFIGSFNASSGIGSAAHLGGLIVGYLIAKNQNLFYKYIY